MASPKWFDLSGLDAKIERISAGLGVFTLRLEVPDARVADMEDTDLLDAGWVEQDRASSGRRVLVNHRSMTDVRSIADSLTAFFSRDEIVASRAPQDMMRQSEQMDGLVERRIIEEVDLADQVTMVQADDRERIMRSVNLAAALQQKRFSAEKGVPLDGRGLEVYQAVVSDLSSEFSEQSVADAAVTFLSRIGARPSDDSDPSATADYSVAMGYLRAKDGHDAAAERNALVALREHVLDGARGRAPRLPVSAEPGMGGQAARDIVLSRALSGGVLSVPMLGGVNFRLDERHTIDSVLRDLPFTPIRDNSMPTRDLANYASAVARATEFVAARLGVDPDNMIPNQLKVPLRFNIGNVAYGRDGVSGRMLSSKVEGAGTVDDNGNVKRGAVTIGVSLRKPGAFVHELAHAIDMGNNLSKEVREGVLEQAGLLSRIQGEIASKFSADDPYAKYLSSPEEIFARVFESSMVHHAVSKGDTLLASVGGLYAVQKADHFAARGDMDATEEFLSLLGEEVRKQRSRAYETSQAPSEPAPADVREPEPAFHSPMAP